MARVAGLVSFQLYQQVISVFFPSDVYINSFDLDLTVILEMADVFATKLQMAARHRVEIHTLIAMNHRSFFKSNPPCRMQYVSFSIEILN